MRDRFCSAFFKKSETRYYGDTMSPPEPSSFRAPGAPLGGWRCGPLPACLPACRFACPRLFFCAEVLLLQIAILLWSLSLEMGSGKLPLLVPLYPANPQSSDTVGSYY